MNPIPILNVENPKYPKKIHNLKHRCLRLSPTVNAGLEPEATMIRKLAPAEWLCDGNKKYCRPIRILIMEKSNPNFVQIHKQNNLSPS